MRFAIVLVLTAATSSGCGPAGPAAPSDPAASAKFVCEKFVRDHLKAPSTAKFPGQNEFLALPGKAKDGGASPASLIAVTLADGLHDPASGAKLLDQQIDLLTSGEVATLMRIAEVGGVNDARKVVHGALLRRFSSSDYVVVGYVDAQNSFGATLRSSFVCMTSNRGIDSKGIDQWRSDGVALLN